MGTKPRFLSYFVALSCAFALSCSSGDTQTSEEKFLAPQWPQDTGPPPLDLVESCSTFPFEDKEFRAGELLVMSLPSNFLRAEELVMWIHSDALEIPFPAAFGPIDNIPGLGNAVFLAPVPPGMSEMKATLQLTGVVDGARFVCPTHEIRVAALTPSPGSTELFVEKTRESLGRVAALHGGDLEALRRIYAGNSTEADHGSLLPLASALFHLEQGLEPVLGLLPATSKEHLDAALGRMNFEEAYAQYGVRPSLPNALYQIDIEDAAELSEFVGARNQWCGLLNSSYATAVTAASLSGITRGGALGVSVFAFAMVGTIMLEFASMACNTYPSKLFDLKVEIDNPHPLEDAPDIQTPKEVTSIKVSARSGEWNYIGSFIKIFLQGRSTWGIQGQISQYAKVLKNDTTSIIIGSGIRGFAGFNTGLSAKSLKQLEFLAEGLMGNIRDFLVGNRIDALDAKTSVFPKSGPYEWLDVDINDPKYTSAYTSTGAVRPGGREGERLRLSYVRAAPDTVLFLPNPNAFGLKDLPEVRKDVGALPIEIDVPNEIAVGPDYLPVNIVSTTNNANNPALRWTAFKGSFPVDETLSREAYNLHAPSQSEQDYPYFIRVESTSNTGLRHPSANPAPRYKLIRVTNGEVRLNPDGECLANSEELELQVSVSPNLEGRQPLFSLLEGEGEVDQAGIYTAPAAGNGQATVRVEIEGRQDQVEILYGQCDCYISIASEKLTFSRFYGIGLTGWQYVNDLLTKDPSEVDVVDEAPTLLLSQAESELGVVSMPSYILTFEPNTLRTGTLNEELFEGSILANGFPLYDSEGGFLEIESRNVFGYNGIRANGLVYHRDGDRLFPVQIRFSFVLNDQACVSERTWAGFESSARVRSESAD